MRYFADLGNTRTQGELLKDLNFAQVTKSNVHGLCNWTADDDMRILLSPTGFRDHRFHNISENMLTSGKMMVSCSEQRELLSVQPVQICQFPGNTLDKQNIVIDFRTVQASDKWTSSELFGLNP
uniref:Uncharacterized protein n=1 Tax=Oryza punctata TaxID=4537 RepID=A0A0E0LRN2_ORYPU